MGMNIKSEEAHQLAKQLSGLTGENLTVAVTTTVRERLARLRRQRHGDDLFARLLAIGKDAAPRLREPFRSADHGDVLYGDDGLPR